MNDSAPFEVQAERLLQERVGSLQRLSYAEASALPDAAGTEVMVSGQRCLLTVFAQPVPTGTLVVAQVARSSMCGLASFLQERGLVFAPEDSVRVASEHELLFTDG